MTRERYVSIAALLLLLCGSLAAREAMGAPAAAPEPVVMSMAKFPVTLGSGEYELLTIVQDFPPGSGIAKHWHGGFVLATVMSGEITLREKGAERVVKMGESWTENPNDVHAVVNAGKEICRVLVSVVMPRGAEVTTMEH